MNTKRTLVTLLLLALLAAPGALARNASSLGTTDAVPVVVADMALAKSGLRFRIVHYFVKGNFVGSENIWYEDRDGDFEPDPGEITYVQRG